MNSNVRIVYRAPDLKIFWLKFVNYIPKRLVKLARYRPQLNIRHMTLAESLLKILDGRRRKDHIAHVRESRAFERESQINHHTNSIPRMLMQDGGLGGFKPDLSECLCRT